MVFPTHLSVGLSREEGEDGPVPLLREAAYSARRLSDARVAGEGKAHPQAVFKPLLVTHVFLCHWGRRASGQGQGWCGWVSKGLGQREG